jgi:hypothetical protein
MGETGSIQKITDPDQEGAKTSGSGTLIRTTDTPSCLFRQERRRREEGQKSQLMSRRSTRHVPASQSPAFCRLMDPESFGLIVLSTSPYVRRQRVKETVA